MAKAKRCGCHCRESDEGLTSVLVDLVFWDVTGSQADVLSLALRILIENSFNADNDTFELGFPIEHNVLYLYGEVNQIEFDGN